MTKFGFSTSSSKWESSYFGGWYNIINQHSFIECSHKIMFDISEAPMKGLMYHEGIKLLKMLLLYSTYSLSFHTESSKIIKYKPFKYSEEKTVVEFDENTMSELIKFVINEEYKPLFIHFSDFLLKCKILIEIEEDEYKGEEGSSENSSEDSSENSSEDSSENSSEDSLETLSEISLEDLSKTRNLKRLKNLISKELKSIKKFEKFSSDSYLTGDRYKELYDSIEFKKASKFSKKREIFYNSQEFLAINKLIDLFDINFDTTSDKIYNLNSGKITPHQIASVLGGNTKIYNKTEEDQKVKPFSVCILMDYSGSMGDCRISSQKSIVKTLWGAFSKIINPMNIYIYSHTGDFSPEVFIHNDPFNQIFETSIDEFNIHRIQNYDGPVIQKIYETIRNYEDKNILFITTSDGNPAGHNYGGTKAYKELKIQLEKMRRDGVITCGIGIDHDTSRLYKYHYYNDSDKPFRENIVNISRLINECVKKEFVIEK